MIHADYAGEIGFGLNTKEWVAVAIHICPSALALSQNDARQTLGTGTMELTILPLSLSQSWPLLLYSLSISQT